MERQIKTGDYTSQEGYISRESAINMVRDLCDGCYLSEHTGQCSKECIGRKVLDGLERLTEADVMPIVPIDWSERIVCGGFMEVWKSTCSRCGAGYKDIGRPNFCPNCGGVYRIRRE